MITVKPGSRKSTCTLMIMTRNGERSINKAIDSALACRCFEKILIMIDNSSTDTTRAIISKYKEAYPLIIHVIGHNWKRPTDFSEARNRMIGYALKHFQTDYASWLDDDEVISDCEAFKFLLSRADGSAYLIWVISPVAGGGSHDMFQPRLFPLVPGAIFHCPVFERVDFSLRDRHIPIVPTSFKAISHDGYTNRTRLWAKTIRNRRIIDHFLNMGSGDFYNMLPQYEHMREQARNLSGRLRGGS